MSENTKRVSSPSHSTKLKKKPKVIGTKASEARAKAITAKLDSAKPFESIKPNRSTSITDKQSIASSKSSQAPSRSSQASTKSSQAPTRSSQAPTKSSQAPTKSSQAPTKSSQAPTKSSLQVAETAVSHTALEPIDTTKSNGRTSTKKPNVVETKTSKARAEARLSLNATKGPSAINKTRPSVLQTHSKTAPPLNSNRLKSTIVVGTKASQARAKAITAQIDSTRPSGPKKRTRTLAETDPLAKSYHTKASGLKERPAWDLRGKVEDMTNLYKLNKERLEGLEKYKRELEITRDEKESAEKEMLLKAAALRTELATLEKNHITNLADLHANQRIEYQKLEDDKLNFDRTLTTLESKVEETRARLDVVKSKPQQLALKNQVLKDKIQKITDSSKEAETESIHLKAKLKNAKKAIAEKQNEIEHKRKDVNQVKTTEEDLKLKLADAHKVRDRLLGIINKLEEDAFNEKAKVVKILNA